MAYILNKTNGSVLAKVEDGSINNSSDLTFVGKNYAGYGEIINENLLKLLENFANKTSPAKPITGQLWYDSANKQLRVYNGAGFNRMPNVEVSATTPNNLSVGDLWFNNDQKKLYVKSGDNNFTLIGPPTTNNQVQGAIVAATVLDQNSNVRYVLKHTINNEVIALTSDSEFILKGDDPLYGQFTAVKQGITVAGANALTGNSANNSHYFWGTAAHSLRLGEYSASDFMLRSDYNAGIQSGFVIDNDNGVLVGSGGVFRFHANAGNQEGKITAVRGTKMSFNLCYPTANDAPQTMLILNGQKLLPGNQSIELGTSANRFNAMYSATADISYLTSYSVAVSDRGSMTAPTKDVSDYSNNVATTAYVRNILPPGMIMMWSGASSNIPAGWVLCDGNNNTPDLRDRFVVGAGALYPTGAAGGSRNSTLPEHSHIISSFGATTASAGDHVHIFPGDDQLSTLSGSNNQVNWQGTVYQSDLNYDAISTLTPSGSSKAKMYGTTMNGSHSHTVSLSGSTANAGVSAANGNLPPYYALCYVMKT